MPNHVNPSKDSFHAFRACETPGPIHMLNLVRLRDKAVYDDNRACSGAAAYRQYGEQSGPIFRALGGRIIWSGHPEVMLIGPEIEAWDIAFIAEYPDMAAFVTMIRDPAYQRCAKHRTAAVKTSRLIRMTPKDPGTGFGT